VEFLLVYIREAHPTDDPKMAQKGRTGEGKVGGPDGNIAQPKTYQEREKVAAACRASLDLEMPFVIDTIDNQVEPIYTGWPERIYIITTEGKIHYKGEKGPSGFKPKEAEASLKKLL